MPCARIARSVSRHVSVIESPHNPQLKKWLSLAAHPEDSDSSWVPVEGFKQVRDLAAKRPIELLLYCDGQATRLRSLISRSRQTARLSERLMRTLSSVETSQGLMAFFEKPLWRWEELTPCVLYLYRLQDPGNLGTLFRTAQAAGSFSVVTSKGTVSCYNAKVVRASAGALFSTPFLEAVAVDRLCKRGYHLWAAAPGGGTSLFEAQFQPPLAVLLGSEGSGLPSTILRKSSQRLHIPMRPEVESLNAAVAGSLILYEVSRRITMHG